MCAQPEELEQRRLGRREGVPVGRDSCGRQGVLDAAESRTVVRHVGSDLHPPGRRRIRQSTRCDIDSADRLLGGLEGLGVFDVGVVGVLIVAGPLGGMQRQRLRVPLRLREHVAWPPPRTPGAPAA